MLYTQKIKIRQSRAVSRRICQIEKESTLTYDLAVKVYLSNGKHTLYDIINMIPGWRAANSLTAHSRFHEAAAKEAFNAVKAFRASCKRKRDRRIRLKKRLRAGKITRYRRNGYTNPDSLLRANNPPTGRRAVSSRARPVTINENEMHLPGIGIIRAKKAISLDGEPRSFRLVDATRKVTRRMADADRQFELNVQLRVPQPAADKTKPERGMDLGARNLATTTDSDGNEKLWNHNGGCRRRDGDRIVVYGNYVR